MLEINGYKVYQGTEIRDAEPDAYKFVKVNGEYRFFLCMTYLTHAGIVRDGEKAESAGFVSITGTGFRVGNDWSSTLKLGPTPDTEKEMMAIIGKPIYDPWA